MVSLLGNKTFGIGAWDRTQPVAGRAMTGGLAALVLAVSSCASSSSPQSAPIVSEDLLTQRQAVEDYPASAQRFQAMDDVFPVARVKATPGDPLPIEVSPLPESVRLGDLQLGLTDALTMTDTNAFLVIRDGALIHEAYFNGSNAETQFIGWSISKSVTSLLFGIALEEGDIASLDDVVEDYLPDMRGTAFEGVTLRNMLAMRAGTSYREQPMPDMPSHVDALVAQSIFENRKRFTDLSEVDVATAAGQGETFNYSTLTASPLGRVIESATGMSLDDYTSEKLWKPAGMQDDAYWMLDGPEGVGDEWAGGGFNASARDFARLGLMVLQGGNLNGLQIVPQDWIDESIHDLGYGPVLPGAPRGYGYQWWTFLNTNISEAVGVHGQFISIDPDTNTVIVKLSYWPERGSGKNAMMHHALFTAIRTAVSD